VGRPITVSLGADIRDYLKKMRDAVTGTQNAARDVQRAGQQMGQGLTTGPQRGLAGFTAGLRGVGPAAAQSGRQGANQFSQTFAQGLITSGGNAPQAFLSALGAALPAFGAAGFGVAIATQLVSGYLAQLEKRRAELTEAGRKLVQAQAAGMLEAALAQDYLVTITGKANYGEAVVAIGKAAADAGIPVEELTTAILTGGKKAEDVIKRLRDAQAKAGGSGGRAGQTQESLVGAKALGYLEDSVVARNKGTAAARVQNSVDRGISETAQKTAAETVRSADAKERMAAAARGTVLPMSQVEVAAARQGEKIRANREAMRDQRILAQEFARYLNDGKVTADEFKKIQAFDGENLANAVSVIARWENLQDKKLYLDIITSYEDDRRLNLIASITGTP